MSTLQGSGSAQLDVVKEIIRKAWRAVLRAAPSKIAIELGGVTFKSSTRQLERVQIRPAEKVTTLAPGYVVGCPPTEAQQSYVAPEEFVAHIKGGYISKVSGITDHRGKRLSSVSCLTQHQQQELANYRPPVRRIRPRFLGGVTLALSTGQESNYFHWMVEVLCRFKLAQESAVRFDWVYVENRLPFQRDSLERLGISDSIIVSSNEYPAVHCAEIVAPSCLEGFWAPRPWMVDYLRKTMWAGDAPRQTERVYITRKKSRYRRTLNEEQVCRFLESRGFRTVILEVLSFGQQVELFRKAEAVLGTHGAGLTNIIFSQPGTKIIEVMPNKYCHWVYHKLATISECEYYCLMAQGDIDSSSWNHQKEDIEVDIELLERVLWAAGF